MRALQHSVRTERVWIRVIYPDRDGSAYGACLSNTQRGLVIFRVGSSNLKQMHPGERPKAYPFGSGTLPHVVKPAIKTRLQLTTDKMLTASEARA